MNSKRILWEVTVAAAIGAGIGIVSALTLANMLGWAKLFSIIVGGIAGALAAGIAFYPKNVWQASCVVSRFFAGQKITSTWKMAADGIRNEDFLLLLKVLSILATAVICLVVEGHYVVPDSGHSWINNGGIMFILSLLTIAPLRAFFPMRDYNACIFAPEEEIRPSWFFPIAMRIRAKTDGWDDYAFGELNLKHYLAWLAFVAIFPIASSVLLPVGVAVLAVDTSITLALLLACTGRLAAMFGAFVGSVIGAICCLDGFPRLAGLAIGCVAGGLAGRWLYTLRCWLAYKEPTQMAT